MTKITKMLRVSGYELKSLRFIFPFPYSPTHLTNKNTNIINIIDLPEDNQKISSNQTILGNISKCRKNLVN